MEWKARAQRRRKEKKNGQVKVEEGEE